MATKQHTPEPWTVQGWRSSLTESGYSIEAHAGTDDLGDFTRPEDARRAVAAVNACVGLSTDALEAGVVAQMLEALQAQHNALDLLFARLITLDKNFFPSQSGAPWEALLKGNAAIAQATGQKEGG